MTYLTEPTEEECELSVDSLVFALSLSFTDTLLLVQAERVFNFTNAGKNGAYRADAPVFNLDSPILQAWATLGDDDTELNPYVRQKKAKAEARKVQLQANPEPQPKLGWAEYYRNKRAQDHDDVR